MKQNLKTAKRVEKFAQEVEKLKPEEVDKFNKEIIRRLDINKAKQNSKTKCKHLYKQFIPTKEEGIWFVCLLCGEKVK